MSGGAIAAIIAATAFAVLVIFISLVLIKVSKAVDNTAKTVEEVNKTIATITQDVDVLSREVEGLLVKSNTLLDDINDKVATIDPVFVAMADLGESVSELNYTSKNLVSKVGSLGKTTAKATFMSKVGGVAVKTFKSAKNKATAKE